jgi:hypothetical protein
MVIFIVKYDNMEASRDMYLTLVLKLRITNLKQCERLVLQIWPVVICTAGNYS